MSKNHTKLLIILTMMFLVSILFAHASLAYSIESVLIEDTVTEDLSTYEVMDVYITNNTNEFFLFTLPSHAYDINLNDYPIDVNENIVKIPLKCEMCNFQVSYVLKDVIKHFSANSIVFYRTLNFPQNPKSLNYTVKIHPEYVITKSIDTDETSIVPIPNKIKTIESGTLIVWTETKPELPKIYQILFKDHEEVESLNQEFSNEFSEGAVWIISTIAAILGALIGISSYKYLNKTKKKPIYVPSSLLSPDEKTVLKLLKESKNIMNQKEIGIQLNWSKSKVSAIMSNLQYKEIIKKEKFGRNFKIEVIKEIEEL